MARDGRRGGGKACELGIGIDLSFSTLPHLVALYDAKLSKATKQVEEAYTSAP